MTRPAEAGISIVSKRNEKGEKGEKGDKSDVNLDTERFQLSSRALNIEVRGFMRQNFGGKKIDIVCPR